MERALVRHLRPVLALPMRAQLPPQEKLRHQPAAHRHRLNDAQVPRKEHTAVLSVCSSTEPVVNTQHYTHAHVRRVLRGEEPFPTHRHHCYHRPVPGAAGGPLRGNTRSRLRPPKAEGTTSPQKRLGHLGISGPICIGVHRENNNKSTKTLPRSRVAGLPGADSRA